MRLAKREVTDPQQTVQIMERCDVVHIALNSDGVPYLLPLNFSMEPDGLTLYFHGAKDGEKYRHLDRDCRASFAMDCMHGIRLDETSGMCSALYESVIGWGELSEVTDESEKHRAVQLLMQKYHGRDVPFDAAALRHTRVLRLQIKARTAKRAV